MSETALSTVAEERLPINLATAAPADVIATFTETEGEMYDELKALFLERIGEELWWYWELGKSVAARLKNARENQELYGEHLIERMAIALGQRTPNILRDATTMYAVWPTKKAFESMTKKRGDVGNRLTWSHLRCLSRVKEETKRLELAKRTLQECLVVAELNTLVVQHNIDQSHPRGRKPKIKVPRSVSGYLSHVRSSATKFVETADTAWLGEEFDLLSEVSDMPTDRFSEEFLDGVATVRSDLQDLQDRIVDIDQHLFKVIDMIKERLEITDDAEPEDDADDDADDDSVNMAQWKNEQRKRNAKPRKKAKK